MSTQAPAADASGAAAAPAVADTTAAPVPAQAVNPGTASGAAAPAEPAASAPASGEAGSAAGEGGTSAASGTASTGDAPGTGSNANRPNLDCMVSLTALPKWSSRNQVAKAMNKACPDLKYVELKKAKKDTWAVLTFESVAQREAMTPLLDAFRMKGRNVGVRDYTPPTRGGKRARSEAGSEGDNDRPTRRARPTLEEGVDGVWKCQVCEALNYASKERCHRYECALPRGTPPLTTAQREAKEAAEAAAAARGAERRARPKVISATVAAGIEWKCPACGRYNSVGDRACTDQTCSQPRPLKEGEVEPERTIHDAVTPWLHLPYDLQLKCKQADMDRNIVRLTRRLRKDLVNQFKKEGMGGRDAGSAASAFLGELDRGRLCDVENIIPSPSIAGYRNKCSFSVGRSNSGKITIGFRWGSFNDTPAVASPLACVHVPDAAKAVAAAFQRFLDGCPESMMVEDERHQFCWRQVTVRTSVTRPQVMVLVLASSNGIEDDLWKLELKRLTDTLAGALPAVTVEPVVDVAQPATADDDVTMGFDAAADTPTPAAGAGSGAGAGAAPASGAEAVANDGGAVDTTASDTPPAVVVDEPKTAASGQDSYAVSSLYLQVYNGPNSAPPADTPVKLLAGDPYLTESLLGFEFRVSPLSFFQVNTFAAEKLYAKVAEWAQLDSTPNSALVDVCCGTGTIGITMAKHAKTLVGVELCEPAVEDARINAKLNGIDNAVFLCDRAENVMQDVLARADEAGAPPSADATAVDGDVAAPEGDTVASNGDAAGAEGADNDAFRVVAVVDPPRGGLMKPVLRSLRTNRHLKRLVYVSCNPRKSFVNDAINLMMPQPAKRKQRTMAGPPFKLVKVVPVDMFPHTEHCELVALFERE